MIEQIQLFLKDPSKVARAATVAFFVMVVIAAWFLFTLPHDLVYNGGMIDSGRATGVYAKLFVVIALAFGCCYTLIFFMQRTKKETIVYLDKKIESSAAQQGFTAGQSSDGLDLHSLREKIKSGKKEEKWQSGLNELCKQMNAGQGALYIAGKDKTLNLRVGYALVLGEGEPNPSFTWGEGLIGQAAASGKSEYLDEMPEGYASRIESGLGGALPKFLFIFPIKKENESIGVIEVATFTHLSESLRTQAIEAGNILSEIS
jgi:methyl-accepting chemotaxis protein